MSTLADSLIASTSRPVRMRRRADLIAVRQAYQDRAYWIVKEPLGLQYYRLEEEEYALLELLDGEASLETIKAAFELKFAPQKVGFAELSALLADLHRKGLACSTSSGQGEQLYQRLGERRRREWLARLSSPLAMRFRGIQPQRLFDLAYPLVRWMFFPAAIVACVGLMIAALALVAVNFDEFHARLPTFHQFFTFETTLYLMAILGITKVLHEFGHGLTCRHFKGEVPELGFMLLVFMPCLYCNVSDAWLFPSKWRRIAVGAAGMYVELLLAAVATFLWWFSVPGIVHHVALSTMLVCSVTTLAFNANPLLRYDGYYILSDLLEIPNLSQKASAVLRRALAVGVLGLEPTDDPTLPRRHRLWFGLYAVASFIYRWVVFGSILWFLHEYFKPYRLQIITQVLVTASIAGLVGRPLWDLYQFLRIPGRRQKIKPQRLKLAAAVVGAACLAVLFVPLPHRVFGTLEITPHQAQQVFVEVPGELIEICALPGTHVQPGDTLARLENVDLELAIARLTTERDRYRAQLANLRHRRYQDWAAGLQLPEVEKTLAAFDEQLAQKLADRSRLTLVATRAGTVFPVLEEPKQPAPDGELPAWSGSPFRRENQSCHLTESTLFCRVGDPRQYEAVVIIDQGDLPFVQAGQPVDVQLDTLPHQVLKGRVTEIARVDVKVSPKHLSNKTGGDLATQTDETGRERPLAVSYQLRVPLDPAEHELRTGLGGRAKNKLNPH